MTRHSSKRYNQPLGYHHNQQRNQYRQQDHRPHSNVYRPLVLEDVMTNDAPLKDGVPIWDFNEPYKVTLASDIEKDMDSLEQEAKLRQNCYDAHPYTEYKRSILLADLRKYYNDLCKKYLNGMYAPKESFNRWLFEQLSLPSGVEGNTKDPLLRRPEIAVESNAIREQIYAEIPSRIRTRYSQQTKKGISSYCMRGTQVLRKLPYEDQNKSEFSEVMQILENVFEWLKQFRKDLSTDDHKKLIEKAKEIETTCAPLFKKIFKPSVDKICSELVVKAKEVVNELQNLEQKQSDANAVKLYYSDIKDYCKIDFDNGTDCFDISMTHLNKLAQLYRTHNSKWDSDLKFFPNCLYIVMRRYESFFGIEEGEGVSFHAALPEKGFNFLKTEMKVCQECFASPFNCYFRHFCSAFPDVDVVFGSRGSFFDFKPIEGSFECGPPYTIEVMDSTANRCLRLLAETEKPLSFVVFVPEWTDTEYGRLMDPSNTKYCVAHFIAAPNEHRYVIGNQHKLQPQERYWTLPFPTHVYFLQNEAAQKVWTVRKELEKKFKEIMES